MQHRAKPWKYSPLFHQGNSLSSTIEFWVLILRVWVLGALFPDLRLNPLFKRIFCFWQYTGPLRMFLKSPSIQKKWYNIVSFYNSEFSWRWTIWKHEFLKVGWKFAGLFTTFDRILRNFKRSLQSSLQPLTGIQSSNTLMNKSFLSYNG